MAYRTAWASSRHIAASRCDFRKASRSFTDCMMHGIDRANVTDPRYPAIAVKFWFPRFGDHGMSKK